MSDTITDQGAVSIAVQALKDVAQDEGADSRDRVSAASTLLAYATSSPDVVA